MKLQRGILDAVPSKRLFLSIIADYDLNKSICELVDNAFDVWTRSGRQKEIRINISLDAENGTITVSDNAGGFAQNELRYIVGPGQTGSSPDQETIGIFGVGTKRAVVALSQDVRIQTRHGSAETFQVEFDDTWLNDDDWEMPYYRVDDVSPGTTRVELQKLRVRLTAELIEQLRGHLGATYARFISRTDVQLLLNDAHIPPRFFEGWSFPPDYLPRHYTGRIITPAGRTVSVDALAGLSSESSPAAGEYGVYFYCNDRLVAPAMKSFDVGFTRGQAGLPHPKVSLTKVIVSLRGDAGEMPWNSSKSDISTKHHVFVTLHDWLTNVVTDYAKVSRIWMGDWPDKVFAHKKGQIVDVGIEDFLKVPRSFLPAPPRSRPRFAERVAAKNSRLSKRKPFITNLYEGVVAAAVVAKQPLLHANWLALNLLDLTLTSSLKNYLINEADVELSDRELKAMLRRTPRVSAQLKLHIKLPETLWARVEEVARRVDALTYGKATPTIGADELAQAEQLTRTVLRRLFRIDADV